MTHADVAGPVAANNGDGRARITRRRLTKGALLAGLILAISGCGFHLRGHSPLPEGVNAIHVTYSDPYSVGDPTVVQALRQRLRERGLLGGSDAPATLAIRNVRDQRGVTAVTPRTGNVAIYEVTTTVRFSYSVRGATQIANETVSISREYSLNAAQRLASITQRNKLVDAMQRQLVDTIFLRIAAYNRQLDGNSQPNDEASSSGSSHP